jgi:cellulose synthase/poly-beta-1,6-N-acetylglucosamine synthase-like glycosyltransferase
MLSVLFLVMAIIISIPLLVIGTECLVTLLIGIKAPLQQDKLEKGVSYKILMPAHNESAIIALTLGTLIPELPDDNPKSIVLIADNCTDNTAALARSMGVSVLERSDTNNRGKGFALDFGIRHLSKNNPPDVLVIIDADCVTDKNSLVTLINLVFSINRPAQMTNIMRVIEKASIKQKIAGFAWLLKNKIRPFAMHKMGFPVALSGTGMALPWLLLKNVQIGHGNIVEDMQLGIDCAINGFLPAFCSDAVIYSDFPEQSSAELSQRTRWEHGHLQTIFLQVPTLIKESWRQKNFRLMAFACDIGVPPLSLLVLIVISGLLLLMICSFITDTTTALLILLLSFLYFAAMLALIWWRFGTEYLTATEIAGIPNYVFSKLSIYFSFIFKRQKEWVRTDRD